MGSVMPAASAGPAGRAGGAVRGPLLVGLLWVLRAGLDAGRLAATFLVAFGFVTFLVVFAAVLLVATLAAFGAAFLPCLGLLAPDLRAAGLADEGLAVALLAVALLAVARLAVEGLAPGDLEAALFLLAGRALAAGAARPGFLPAGRVLPALTGAVPDFLWFLGVAAFFVGAIREQA